MNEHAVGSAQRPPGPPDASDAVVHEVRRIILSGTIWTAAAMIAPAAGLGPLLAAGWRPWSLPVAVAVVWWGGVLAAAAGVGLLMWAGCPVLGFSVGAAHRQKVRSIRVGIVLATAGFAVAGFAVLLSPVPG